MQLIGMRHWVVHNYLFVDQDVVWDVVVRDLEPLASQLAKLLAE